MIHTFSAYDARTAWTHGVDSDEPYPGKIRAVATFIAQQHLEAESYHARRYAGFVGIVADLITASVAAFVPVRPIPMPTPLPPAADSVSAGWVPARPVEKLTSRCTTGPPATARPMTPGGFLALISP